MKNMATAIEREVIPPGSCVDTTAATAEPAAAWTVADMAKAIGVFIIGTIAVTIPAAIIATSLLESGQEVQDDASALTVILFTSFIAQEVLLLAAALRFGPWKYKLSLASLGLRKPESGPGGSRPRLLWQDWR
jgi:hypothetical protein